MKRVLLKLSGEALSGDKKSGFDEKTVAGIAEQVKVLSDREIEVGIVIGGGNFWRGRSSGDMDRVRADQIGMLATVMNCIYVSDAFRLKGIKSCVMTPFVCGSFTQLFSKGAAIDALSSGTVVFCAGGTGHPYFSTDTATLLYAIEIEAEMVLLAKAVDGVYDVDPRDNPHARKYTTITIGEVLERGLRVVDLTATVLARENKMPMYVFALNEENSILRAVEGLGGGTSVTV